jgi:hypothetical protein
VNTEWIEPALGVHPSYSSNPLWGHLAESDQGDLLVPAWWWSRHKAAEAGCDGWWDRPLDLANPLHWLPYLRSRLGGRVAMVE